MNLLKAISKWDGQSVKDLEPVWKRFSSDPQFAETAISLIGEAELEVAATWLLKRYLESEGELTATQTGSIFKQANNISNWESKIQVLQSSPYFKVSKRHLKPWESFVRTQIESSNKLIKAWALTAFAEIAKTFPDYEREANALLDEAAENGSAAIKARVRDIRKNWK
ncbi:MAG: hypothetical protein AAFN77_07560 [Planctomycetota bacterium]